MSIDCSQKTVAVYVHCSSDDSHTEEEVNFHIEIIDSIDSSAAAGLQIPRQKKN